MERSGYVSYPELMRQFGCSRWTLQRWLAERGIQRFRFLGDPLTYIAESDVERLRQPVLSRRIGRAAGE